MDYLSKIPELKLWVEMLAKTRERTPVVKSQKPGEDVKYGKAGRPPRLPKAVQALLKEAGYMTYGARIRRDMRTFFTLEAAGARFRELYPELKAAVGSPEALLEISRGAETRLRSASRRGVRGLCFEDALAVEIELHAAKRPGGLPA
jgi:hypothetical protein